MNIEEIENQIPYVEDMLLTDVKVLLALVIHKLETIEEDIQDIKDTLYNE